MSRAPSLYTSNTSLSVIYRCLSVLLGKQTVCNIDVLLIDKFLHLIHIDIPESITLVYRAVAVLLMQNTAATFCILHTRMYFTNLHTYPEVPQPEHLSGQSL